MKERKKKKDCSLQLHFLIIMSLTLYFLFGLFTGTISMKIIQNNEMKTDMKSFCGQLGYDGVEFDKSFLDKPAGWCFSIELVDSQAPLYGHTPKVHYGVYLVYDCKNNIRIVDDNGVFIGWC